MRRFSRTVIRFSLLLCLGGLRPVAGQALHDYNVTVDAALTELRVEARFATPTTTVNARARDAGRFIADVRDCDADRPLTLRNGRLQLPDVGIRCISYRVDLEAAAAEERRNLSLADDNVLVSPSLWLWRPALTSGTQIRVRFMPPPGVQIAVPWTPVADRRNEYILSESPESANAPALFGDFTLANIDVPGAHLRVSLPKTEPALDRDLIIDWLQATATDVTLAYGRFPNPSAHIIVIPIGQRRWSSNRAVPFGRVIRDGGEVVELFVNHGKPLEDFLRDWTATHEFSHLMLPYLDSRQRWVSEGFAQYYQNVLLARSGAYEQAEAWQKIHAGLQRGQASRPELSPNEAAARGVRGARMKIYWAGAAIALMADVELRERSSNQEALDDVLERLQTCCLPSERVWTGRELFTRMDELTGGPALFVPLYERYADAVGFPDSSALFDRLGVHVTGTDVDLREHSELAAIRRAITDIEPEVARWRRGLLAGGRSPR